MLRMWSRRALVVLLFLIVASCSGGGCSSGCAGCGVKPLPGGYPKANAITNAASIRVTRPGLDFLQANVGTLASKALGGAGGVLHFNVPTSTQSITFVNITICPQGPKPNANPPECVADINLAGAKLKIDAITPHAVKISGTVPVQLKLLPVDTSLGSLDVEIGVGGCGNVSYADVPIDIELPLIAEKISPRDGYMKIDAQNAVVNATIDQNIVNVCNGGFIGFIINAFKSLVVSQFTGPLTNQIKSALISQTCTKPVPTEAPPCPTGSQPDVADLTKATKCVFTSDTKTCVPTMLGMDGHVDLSSALASISPGTSGGLDFMLAANGDMDPAPGAALDANGHTTNGMTLGMFGGTLPQPKSDCVPVAENPVPMGIPIPDEMTKDKQTPWPATDATGPHLGIALAGRYLDYSFTSVYNSGLLCLGVSTEQFQQLNSGLLSLVIGSINKLTFESKPAAAAITTRPQAAPKIKIGHGTDIKKDPLLAIQLNKFAIDFYIWSEDRFVRIFTFTSDVTVPVNLQTAKNAQNPNGGLLPVIGDLTLANGVVTNADLLTDDPTQIAGALQGLFGGIVGTFIGKGLKPFDVSTALKSLGLALTIPDGGIRKLSKGTDDYLAIFADLALAAGTAMPEVNTEARIIGRTVHPEAMSLTTADRAKFPTLRATFSSPGGEGAAPIEYSYWIDETTRSAWSREAEVTIDSDYLLLQGKHVLHVVARTVGQPQSEDSTPADVRFTIDTLAPHVSLHAAAEAGKLTVKAWDLVSDDAALVARHRTSSGAAGGSVGEWSAWAPLADGVVETGDAASVDVEVKDEEGNVGSVSQALVRGRPDPSLKPVGGCGCSTPGGVSDAPLAWAGSAALLAGILLLAARRRRPGRTSRTALLGIGAFAAVAASSQGCSCGDSSSASTTGCGADCNQVCGSGNTVGLVGSYTSLAKAKDGTIWVAGYNDGDVSDPHGGNLWGDLVVGKYDSGKSQVMWTTVDGLPPKRTDGTCPSNDPHGWRGGETDLGDDVGLWTSMQLDAGDHPMVSYYDASHAALKFASFDGSNWSSHTVMQADKSDIGRYGKMAVVGGNPVIAFLVMENGTQGKVRSKVTLARASKATPGAPSDWAFEDALVDENGPCRSKFCDAGQVCIKETGICQPTVGGCTPADCGGGGGTPGSATLACVTIAGKATCGTQIDSKYVDSYPNAVADYVSMAVGPQGLGMVVYDRLHGNLVGLQQVGGKWTTTILDGETGSRAPGSGADGGVSAVDTGDVGVGASLFIAQNGDWHVSYVNGFTEAVQYLTVPGGNKPALKPEVVDNGRGVAGAPFGDGQHVVGDDSFIYVDDNGVVTIYFQDATAGTLHVANGAPAAGTHKWSVKVAQQPNKFAGFFPRALPGDPQVANFWRMTDHGANNVTGDVSFVTP